MCETEHAQTVQHARKQKCAEMSAQLGALEVKGKP